MTSVGKFIVFFLLIIFTIQVTDLTCVDEDASFHGPEKQGEVHLLLADLDEEQGAYAPGSILDECQCPCHLSFTHTTSAEVSSIKTISLSLFAPVDLSLKKISADIFQPPKVLI